MHRRQAGLCLRGRLRVWHALGAPPTRSPRSPFPLSGSRLPPLTATSTPPQVHITAKTYPITIDGKSSLTHTIPNIAGHYLAEFAVDEVHVDKAHGEKACSDNNITKIAALTSNHGGYFKELSCANQEYEVTSEFYCQKCAPGFLPNSANTKDATKPPRWPAARRRRARLPRGAS